MFKISMGITPSRPIGGALTNQTFLHHPGDRRVRDRHVDPSTVKPSEI